MTTLIPALAVIIVLTIVASIFASYRLRRQRAREEALAKRVAEETVNLALDTVRGEQWRRQASS